MADVNNVYKKAEYTTFKLLNDATYNLEVGGYSSSVNHYVGDALTFHNGAKFSAKDQDNDENNVENCATKYESAGWFRNDPCYEANPFGKFLDSRDAEAYKGVVWRPYDGWTNSLNWLTLKLERTSAGNFIPFGNVFEF